MAVLFLGGSFKKEKKTRLKCFPVIYKDSQRLTRGARGFVWSVNLGDFLLVMRCPADS